MMKFCSEYGRSVKLCVLLSCEQCEISILAFAFIALYNVKGHRYCKCENVMIFSVLLADSVFIFVYY